MTASLSPRLNSGVDPAALSSVIGTIYEAVFDREAWPSALQGVCAMVDGCAASMISHAVADQTPERAAEFGTDPLFSRAYVESYARINPLFGMSILEMTEGETRALYRTIDLRVFHRTRFYREWVQPQGWGDWLASMLARSPSHVSLLAVARKEAGGPFSEAQLAMMDMLVPHIQRAARLAHLFDQPAALARGMAALLDRLTIAALLVDSRSAVVFANGPAQTMLAAGDILALASGGRLRLADPEADRIASAAIKGETTRPEVALVKVPRGAFVVSVMPPSPETGDLVAVLVTAPEAVSAPPGPVLRSAYGLTDAEMRVLSLLIAGRHPAEIASGLGITLRTVRAHLQKLFDKMGVERQSDLILSVLRLALPVRESGTGRSR
jgi:DNA-binding CsgD family transcriptional regulator